MSGVVFLLGVSGEVGGIEGAGFPCEGEAGGVTKGARLRPYLNFTATMATEDNKYVTFLMTPS